MGECRMMNWRSHAAWDWELAPGLLVTGMETRPKATKETGCGTAS